MDIPDLVRVTPLHPSDLLLGYSDGSLRKFACAPYLDRGVFSRLRDSTLFGQAHVTRGILWGPGALDIAHDPLYLKSAQVSPQETTSN